MNTKQKIVLWIGVAAFAAIAVMGDNVVSWLHSHDIEPSPLYGPTGDLVDQIILLVVVAVATLAGLLTLRDKRARPKTLRQLEEEELLELINGRDSRWQDQVAAKRELHLLKRGVHGAAIKGHGRGWGLKETAKYLGESVGTVSQDIRLARIIDTHSKIAQSRNKAEAWGLYVRMVNEGKIDPVPPYDGPIEEL